MMLLHYVAQNKETHPEYIFESGLTSQNKIGLKKHINAIK